MKIEKINGKVVVEMTKDECEELANALGNAGLLIEGMRSGLVEWGDEKAKTVKSMLKLVKDLNTLSSDLFDAWDTK